MGGCRKKQGHEPGIVLDVPAGAGDRRISFEYAMRQLNFRAISRDRSQLKARFRPSSGAAPLTVS
jgi:hypothetical protein